MPKQKLGLVLIVLAALGMAGLAAGMLWRVAQTEEKLMAAHQRFDILEQRTNRQDSLLKISTEYIAALEEAVRLAEQSNHQSQHVLAASKQERSLSDKERKALQMARFRVFVANSQRAIELETTRRCDSVWEAQAQRIAQLEQQVKRYQQLPGY